MKSFAEAFFQYFGARVQVEAGELVVDLPPELDEVFGKERLYLVFPQAEGQGRELSPHEDLLVYGSRIFDRMLGLLAGRGEAAYLPFPQRVSVEQHLPLPLHNCRLLENEIGVRQDQFYIFNFRASYLSDEKLERFIAIGLDHEGRPAPDTQQMLAQFEAQELALDGPVSVKTRPLDQMLEIAGEMARQQVSAEVAELEAVIKPRLEKVLLRLSSYYRRLSDEVNTGDPGQDETVRAELQQELKLKIAEELERHRLRVTIEPISYAVAVIPFAHYRLRLATPNTEQEIDLARNLYTGQIEQFSCFYCRQPLDHLALCERAHPVHAHCLEHCRQCGRDICRGCGIQSCAICQAVACVDCRAACNYCERWLCAQHVQSCAICDQPYCSDHGLRCRRCNQNYCHKCGAGGECLTCRQALAAPPLEVVNLPAIAGLRPEQYRWRQAENKLYVVYLGQRRLPSFIPAWLGGQVVVVVNRAGELVYWDRHGLLKRILERRM